MLHEFFARPIFTVLYPAEYRQALAALHALDQEIGERIDVICRKRRVVFKDRLKLWPEQHIVRVYMVVVQISAGIQADRSWAIIEGGMGIAEILLILSNLGGWMQHFAMRTSHPGSHQVLTQRTGALLPLFELDNDGLLVALLVLTTDQTIEAPGGQRQLVFEDHPMVVQATMVEDI